MERFDVAIIGSGPSAAAAHQSLLHVSPGLRVCILEAGGPTTAYSGGGNVKPSLDFRLDPTIYMGKGGTSELWHYVLAPLDEIDFEQRPSLGANGWPINLKDLLPYYEKALSFLGVRNPQIFNDPNSQFNLDDMDVDDLANDFEPKLFIQLKKRWRSKDYWDKNQFKLHYFHMVRRLYVMGSGVEILSTDISGCHNPLIFAKKVIVAAGGLNTPQIIYNTELEALVRSHVGKVLLDHPMGVGMQIKRPKAYSFEIFTSKREDDLNKKIAFRLKDSIQRKDDLPNSSFFFRPSFKEGYSQTTEELKAQIIVYRNYLKQHRFPLKMTFELLRDWNLVNQIIGYKTGLLSKVSLFDIFCVTEQISRESRILFEKGADGFFNGKCVWKINQIDYDLNVLCLSKIVEWVQASPHGGRVTVYPKDVPWIERATSAAHHIGTVPMSSDMQNGAVDSNCAVFGLNESVFVADASVMPSAGCANVTLTSMAIANRVGEYVGKTL